MKIKNLLNSLVSPAALWILKTKDDLNYIGAEGSALLKKIHSLKEYKPYLDISQEDKGLAEEWGNLNKLWQL